MTKLRLLEMEIPLDLDLSISSVFFDPMTMLLSAKFLRFVIERQKRPCVKTFDGPVGCPY